MQQRMEHLEKLLGDPADQHGLIQQKMEYLRGSGSHNWTYSSKDAAKEHERPALAMFLSGAIMHVYALFALFSYRRP